MNHYPRFLICGFTFYLKWSYDLTSLDDECLCHRPWASTANALFFSTKGIIDNKMATIGGEQLCQGKDVFERMNYLFQAGQLLSKKDHVAASLCGNIMVSCAKRSVLRMEPDVKRSICKSCQIPLIPGESAKVRLISKPVKAVKWTCLLCKTTRTIPTKRGYKLWIKQSQSVIKTFDYTSKPMEIIDKDDVKKVEESIGSIKEEVNICDGATSSH